MMFLGNPMGTIQKIVRTLPAHAHKEGLCTAVRLLLPALLRMKVLEAALERYWPLVRDEVVYTLNGDYADVLLEVATILYAEGRIPDELILIFAEKIIMDNAGPSELLVTVQQWINLEEIRMGLLQETIRKAPEKVAERLRKIAVVENSKELLGE